MGKTDEDGTSCNKEMGSDLSLMISRKSDDVHLLFVAKKREACPATECVCVSSINHVEQ